MTLDVSHFRPVDARNYRRFDWKTPGSALEDAGKSDNPYWGDPEQTAANYYDTVMSTDFQGSRRKLRDYVSDPRHNPLLNANRERDPQITERWMRTTRPLERNQPGGSNWKARKFFEDMPAATTRSEKAGAWDALARERQRINQLPPQGIMDSLPGMIASGLLTSWIGAPYISAITNAAKVPAGVMKVADWAGRIKSGVDYGKKIVGP